MPAKRVRIRSGVSMPFISPSLMKEMRSHWRASSLMGVEAMMVIPVSYTHLDVYKRQVIARQLPVTTEFITQEEAQGRFDLERLPDGASETVRVVKVGDYDECLCIGVHVENTSEIGTFKIISHDWNEEAKRWRMRFKLV